jgi:hypothetical protein
MSTDLPAAKQAGELTFLEESHQYFHGYRELLAVTRVLELNGFSDFSHVPLDLLEAAQKRGDCAHKGCHFSDVGASDYEIKTFIADEGQDPERIFPYVVSWRLLLADGDIKILGIEEVVCDLTYGYAGRYDRKLLWKTSRHGERMGILDLKTSKPERWHGLQLAAYARTIKGAYHRWGCYLQPDGKMAKVEEYTTPTDKAVFLNALAVAQWKLNGGN